MPRRVRYPAVYEVEVAPDGTATYRCEFCGVDHVHQWHGDGGYVPKCPYPTPPDNPSPYWRSPHGVRLRRRQGVPA